MKITNIVKSTVVCASMALFSVGDASAATLSFDGASDQGGGVYVDQGFSFDDTRIVSGPCFATAPCLALNDNESTTITRVGGGTFSLTSLWFKLIGKGIHGSNALTVTSAGPAGVWDLTQTTINPDTGLPYEHNKGYYVDFMAFFTNVTSITFTTAANGGNVRIDDIVLVPTPPAPVPLPAGAGLLAMALGGLGLASRRKKA